jgi:hypothetical protein
MLDVLEVIEGASNIDLKSGVEFNAKLVNMGYLKSKYSKSQDKLKTENNSTIDVTSGRVGFKNIFINIKEIIIIEEEKIILKKSYNRSSSSYLIVYNGLSLLLRKEIFDSFLIQALIFDKYNRDYFTKVAESDNFLILKIKKQ